MLNAVALKSDALALKSDAVAVSFDEVGVSLYTPSIVSMAQIPTDGLLFNTRIPASRGGV